MGNVGVGVFGKISQGSSRRVKVEAGTGEYLGQHLCCLSQLGNLLNLDTPEQPGKMVLSTLWLGLAITGVRRCCDVSLGFAQFL